MNKLPILILLLFSIIPSKHIYCQQALSPSKLKELAESAELQKDFNTAVYYYEQLVELKPKQNTKEKLADLYMKIRSFEKAIVLYRSLLSDEKKQSELNLKLGLCYKAIGDYEYSIYYFQKCKTKDFEKLNAYILKTELKGASFAIKQFSDTGIVTFNKSPLSINTKYLESAPEFINDSLIVYATQIINNKNSYQYNDTIDVPKSALFFASKNKENWIKENKVQINESMLYLGNGTFSLNKEQFYFTNSIKNWNNESISQLYVCEYKNGIFAKPFKIKNKVNDPFYSSTQPTPGTTYNPNFEIIYFSSNRPGGKGGYDIWYTTYNKIKNNYGAPINAGRRINTPLDEVTPFYDCSTKTLYYSSNGHAGFGGYDVYRSTGELKSWTNPNNIGGFINSYADELYFILNPSRNAGFIVTNKAPNASISKDFCCYDLAYFTFNNPNQLLMRGNLVTKINPIIAKLLENDIEFRDSIKYNNYLDNAIVSLYLKTEKGTDSIYITSDTTNSNGLFEFNADNKQSYTLIIKKDNEIKTTVNINTKDLNTTNDTSITLDINPIETLPEVPLVIKNIYYDFGSSELSDEAKIILDSTLILLLKNIENIKIEISSHTDNIGDSIYNYKLSEQRAQKVMRYIISKGINKKRLSAKGYGESDPIAKNQNTDGTDYPEGRKKNRRTEFKIIGNFESVESF